LIKVSTPSSLQENCNKFPLSLQNVLVRTKLEYLDAFTQIKKNKNKMHAPPLGFLLLFFFEIKEEYNEGTENGKK